MALDRLAPWLLGAAALALRVPAWGRYPTEWDSAQFVMALDRFDVVQHLPHSPGYWLYVALGRVVRAATPLSGHQSLLLVTSLASAAVVAFTYVAGQEIGGRWLGWAAAGCVLTSPFLWFYGAVAGTYGFDALAEVLLLLFAWRARPGSRDGQWAALVLGLSAGLRQLTPILLAPLALVALARSVRSLRAATQAAAVGLGATLLWLVPLAVEQPGGLRVWRAVSSAHWRNDVGSTSPLAGAPLADWGTNLARASAYGMAATASLLILAAAGLLLARRRRRHDGPPPSGRGAGLLWWAVLPPLVFTLMVFFAKPGHVLAYLPGATLLALRPGSRTAGRARLGLTVAVLAVGAFSVQRFVAGEGVLPDRLVSPTVWLTNRASGAPFRVSARAIRRSDVRAVADLELARGLRPEHDVVVYVWEAGGRRFRLASYVLPQFHIDLVKGGAVEWTAYHTGLLPAPPGRIEVPPGGSAVFVLDRPSAELVALGGEGRAQRLAQPGLSEVWVVRPDARLFGVEVVTGDGR